MFCVLDYKRRMNIMVIIELIQLINLMHFVCMNCYGLISNQISMLTRENNTCWDHSKHGLPPSKYCLITKLDTRSMEGYVYSVCEVAVHEGGST